ncbi:anthranilate synthase component I [Rubrobacter tropicus]|uniref:Anthranilate synthase component 1 n=1 Tax=Rubrobacter tropicus TaxID=2653851 RepID=A0A6G8QBE3_9ACTN|nr:anthranilate synthase component I [Rubrobacter tropicus]QIN83617.1 anthranilate synthase component I [Rubrobacter tropicus]
MTGTADLNLTPSIGEARELARSYDVVPLYAEFIGDLETPISAVLRFAEEDTVFLLESAEAAERFGRYSFLGFDPKRTLSYRDGVYTVVDADGVREVPAKDPFRGLAEIVGKKSVAPLPHLPAFVGGAVGFFSYDAVRYLEKLPAELAPPDDLGVPEALFAVTDTLVVFDHLRHKVLVVSLVDAAGLRDVEGEGFAAAYRRAADDIRRISERLSAPLARRAPRFGDGSIEVSSNFTRAGYEEAVGKAKEYIRAGDAFQIVPSQRFSAEVGDLDPLLLYRGLRTVNPSPYMTYLKMGDLTIVGASPEPLVRVEGRRVMTRPVAGTRWRGGTPEEDAALAEELLADEKERAEHVMLVDLGRNDLGRVGEIGSVELAGFMEVERYSHVMHIVSTVEANLRKDLTALDALAAAFPAGTVSGAPKVRAMEIIDELEPTRRGPYAGATGYYGIDGRLDTCITLRTALLKDGVAYFQAGGGVVADSVPSSEYEETRNKAGAIRQALEVARSRGMWL